MARQRKDGKKGFFCEFREFALRGNMFDLAVGVIIGGAFSRIVTSLVESIFMPILSFVIGGIDISALEVPLPILWRHSEEITLPAGVFLQSVIEFIFVAFCLFLVIKVINRLRASPPEAPPPPPSKTEELLTEIRNLLSED